MQHLLKSYIHSKSNETSNSPKKGQMTYSKIQIKVRFTRCFELIYTIHKIQMISPSFLNLNLAILIFRSII
jgi:hypothetical protein